MRSLHHLTKDYNLCTLLLNSAVGLHPSDNPKYNRRHDESSNVSIFKSTPGKPALGKTYAYLVDTSLFLSKVPRGDEPPADEELVEVIEVVKDRYGAREGRWAPFQIVVSGNRRELRVNTVLDDKLRHRATERC